MSDKNPTRVIDGVTYELAMWLVVEKRPDGIPLVMRLCQEGYTVEQTLVAAGLCTSEEIASGEAQQRLKPEFQLMWTQRAWLVRETA